MLLGVEGIDFFVGKTHILRSVSLQVEPGEIVGLLGRNGAGKSSILKSIMGLYHPQQGTIRFKDQPITKAPTRQRVLQGLAYAPEDARVFPELSVKENISLGMWVAEASAGGGGFQPERGFEIFPKLQDLWDRRGGNLSGGEKKMVSITRALALSPSLLLLDESFEGLAPLVVRHFMEAMRRIRDLGISIILAESNLANASLVVERAYVVERGEILFAGTPREIAGDEKLCTIIGR
ncbi:MAG: ATP-binding cassette domain-containing protein [Desulfarculus sp.]|jgi:branched-chain amino acid transport system ATP-binding protein|nr:MAG: ATP-binding cassette domain-containing protein [Desulfarculus sp.]